VYLKKLEIFGFKSFAKKTVLEFEPGIISVVGPNGSGKSNIADSLRWVFGEQSMKLLRGKKSEDVIFAGSDQKARLGTAEVSVYFDNHDHRIPLDYDEVAISRRLYRDGNSEYLINGNQVRLLDIQELLNNSGFGTTSYHVIGQGTIDQLVLGGPAAIKDLLEEASGVKPYYVKRDRAKRRLERTGSNLEQVQALVSEIEPRLRSLRRQTKRLEERSHIEKELREGQVIYYGQILRGLEQQLQELGGKVQVFDKQTGDLNREISELLRSIEHGEKDNLGSTKVAKKLRADLEVLHKEKLTLQERQATTRGQLKVASPKESALGQFWPDIKNKFHAAYERFLKLVGSFDVKEAEGVKVMLGEIALLIKRAEGEDASPQEALVREEERLSHDLQKLFGDIQKLENDLRSYTEQEEKAKEQLFVRERLLRTKQETLLRTNEQKNSLAIEQTRFVTRREAYEQEATAELGADFKMLLERSKSGSPPANLQEKIGMLKRQLAMIGGVDDMIVQEYRETEERYQYLTNQSADLQKGVKDLQEIIVELDEVIKKEFNEAFQKITEKFVEYFRILFNGGRASMALLRERPTPRLSSPTGGEESKEGGEDEEDLEFQALSGKAEIVGIEIRATPPGKKLAGIAALSGGERALTSIALLSSLLATFPSPFVVLDEVDAALDEANSIRFGKILGTLAHKTQFITITHNRETMRQSHTLYGVTMGDDSVSKVLSLKLDQAAVYSTKN